MNEDEPFLARWSRLKRRPEPQSGQDSERSRPDEPDATRPEEPRAKDAGGTSPAQREPDRSEEPFDLSKLPKIEELTADSDFVQFMDPRVPAGLRQAALRRAWTLDPRIRDFIEMADWNYDWNVPGGAPGYGPMPAGTNVAALLAQVFTTPSTENTVQEPSESPRYDKLSHREPKASEPGEQSRTEVTPEESAPRPEPDHQNPLDGSPIATGASAGQRTEEESVQSISDTPRARRRHGGALPT